MFLEKKKKGEKGAMIGWRQERREGKTDEGRFRVFQNYAEIHPVGQDVG